MNIKPPNLLSQHVDIKYITTLLIISFFCFILSNLPANAQSRINIGSGYLVMTGGISGTPVYLTVDNSNTNAIDHSSSGHIISSNEYQRIKWFIGTSTGNFTFPLGVGATYIPFQFNITSAGVGSGSVSLSTWYTLNNADGPDGVYTLCPNENSAIDRFWTIDLAGYSTKPTADIRFHYNTAELDGIPEASLVAQRGNLSLSCPWDLPVGTVEHALDYVEVTGVSSFSPWTLSSKETPLPIELLDFTAEWKNAENNIVSVKWTTASEINNDYFEVQRSLDGINFTTINTTIGAGNSSNIINYAYDDIAPIYENTSYYRLKQVDFDGYLSYSNIEAINPPSDINFISVYPNPSTDYFSFLVFSSVDTEILISVYNNLGQLVYSTSCYTTAGVTNRRVDVSKLVSGSYIVSITTENNRIIQKQFLTK